MKIAFIGQKGIPAKNGGVERYVESLALSLANLGQEVFVYNRQDYLPERLKEFKGIKLINLPYLKNKNLANITHTLLANLNVFKHHVDIVHFQGIGPSLLCWMPKLLNKKIKIVATLHSFDYGNEKWGSFAKSMLRLGEKVMCRWADEVIVLTESMKTYVEQKYHRQVNLIPNGANLYDQVGEDKIMAWGLSKSNYIISVSRLIKLKGLQYLIEAFKNLKTDKKLVIVGDGEYQEELEKLAGDNQRVIFTGNQTGHTLDQLYANAYLFVQTSEMEGLSISLLEAMAHKTACLVSDIDANREAINTTGFTFKVKDVDDLQNKLVNLLDDQSEVEEKAALAYERVKNNFNWPEITKKVLAVYQK
jgi:glycosyltransferase involved in cell wall biosynthesis